MLPDLGLGALLEHDQGPPAERGGVGVDRNLDLDRLLQLHPGRYVNQHAVAPAGLVAGDEGVLDRHE